jgi:hypothetical protein
MKLESPDTVHHGDKDRIMCVDFHPFCSIFVTGGGDSLYHDKDFDTESSDFRLEIGFIKVRR